MATNPMQRKARNSILLGILIGLLIGGAICVLLFLQLNKLQQEIKTSESKTKNAYVAISDIKAGSPIDASMLKEVSADQSVVPADAVNIIDLTELTIAKVDIKQGTVLSGSLIEESNQKTTSDLREQQYNMIILPQYLDVDDYIDIRLTLANGQDYIVVSKKRVKQMTADTIWINMYEEETLAMTNAIVEAYKMPGAKLYATKYVDPGIQNNVTPTYVPSNEVINLINIDKNITEEARQGLVKRYTTEYRNGVQNELNSYADEAKDNLESNLAEEITKSKDARQEYIDTLNAATTVDSY